MKRASRIGPLLALAACTAGFALSTTASAEQFINFTTNKQPDKIGATDLRITLNQNIGKGRAVLPTDTWDPKNTTIAGKSITFNTLAGSSVGTGDVATGTISLKNAAPKGATSVVSAYWSYPGNKADIMIPVPQVGVQISKIDVGGKMEGEVTVSNMGSSTVSFSNFLLGYNIPQYRFGDSDAQLAGISTNNLYLSSNFGTTMVGDGLSSLAGGSSASFTFGLGSVTAADYIAVSFNTTDTYGHTFGVGMANNVQSVPEPASMALLGTGLAAGVFARSRARKAMRSETNDDLSVPAGE